MGLAVAAVVLDGMKIDATAFIEAIVIFTVAFALMTTNMANQLRKRQSSALGEVDLTVRLIAVRISDLISDGLTIDGIGTWVAATVIVWVASLLAAFILPYLGLKKYMEEKRVGPFTPWRAWNREAASASLTRSSWSAIPSRRSSTPSSEPPFASFLELPARRRRDPSRRTSPRST